MNGKRLTRLLAMSIGTWVATGCVPVPAPIYAPDPAQGRPLFLSCAINKSVPGGIELQVDGVLAQVDLNQRSSRGYVEVRLDVPPGKTVRWQSDLVSIVLHDGRPPVQARFPNISLVDSPAINSFDTPPALAQYIVPVQTPMVGGSIPLGTRLWPRHFWMAARVDTGRAPTVTVTLPDMTVNDVPARFPALDFHRSVFVVLTPLNC